MRHLTPLAAAMVAVACVTAASASKILFIAPVTSPSHMNFFGRIITILADRGHQITFLTSYPGPKHPNITEVDAKTPLNKYMSIGFENKDDSMYSQFKLYFDTISNACLDALGREEVQRLDVEDFDLLLFSAYRADCFMALVDQTKVPFALVSPNTIFNVIHTAVGNVEFPSMGTTFGSSDSLQISFYERLKMSLINELISSLVIYYLYPLMKNQCQERGLCSKNMKDILHLQQQTSLVFINSLQSLETPVRPFLPTVIHAGGISCRSARPLPQELESWVEGAGEAGFIYMSLGSAIKSDMPEKHRRILVNVFGSLSQRVLWKWDQETIEDLPENVKISSWLPQQDILGHPKLKLFISHGGLFSTLEATYHAVPVLGMPVFGDQMRNIDVVVAQGWGEMIDWEDLSEELFKQQINMLLTNPRYSETAKRRSELMRDQPMPPQDKIVYWTEYLIRHKGAPHMRSPFLNMSWYEVYNVDVWATLASGLFVITATTTLLFIYLCRALLRYCRRRSCGTKKKGKKRD